MTPKELMELAETLSIAGQHHAAAVIRSYAELLSMMEFIDDSVTCSPRLRPEGLREMALELGWESIHSGWDRGAP